MLLPQSVSQRSQKARTHLWPRWYEAVKRYICSGVVSSHHYPWSSPACKACAAVSGPGMRKSSGHLGKMSQGISALPGQAEKIPEVAGWVSLSLGNTLLGDEGWMSH